MAWGSPAKLSGPLRPPDFDGSSKAGSCSCFHHFRTSPMPRTFIPRGFTLDSSTSPASVSLSNAQGHHFSLHPVSPTTVRVVHELPRPKYHQKVNGSGINWEVPLETVKVTVRALTPCTCGTCGRVDSLALSLLRTAVHSSSTWTQCKSNSTTRHVLVSNGLQRMDKGPSQRHHSSPTRLHGPTRSMQLQEVSSTT